MKARADNPSASASFHRLGDAFGGIAKVEPDDVDRVINALLRLRPLSNPHEMRKLILRRIWQNFYPGVPRCPAAKLIAADWITVRAHGFIEPGSRDYFFRRLDEIGVARVGERTIANDLDYDLDR